MAVWTQRSSIMKNASFAVRTLRTLHRQVCDEEELQIECWPDTVISISQAEYGQPAAGRIQCLERREPPHHPSHCTPQDVREGIQSSCREKQKCHLKISSALLKEDPCPGVQRFLNVAFKCRPSKFFTRVVCENEKLKLRCRKSLRIVIYSAFFGSATSGADECPEVGGSKYEDCEASFATETAMNSCHGRRRCSLSADSIAFGLPPCSAKARMFLKVVYTCGECSHSEGAVSTKYRMVQNDCNLLSNNDKKNKFEHSTE
ncbi:Protein eva-1 C [Araneus ventricosus]|uniref:Protein eva-1 C n=1 Tax=Araneus ventricosus TaxID=182803 RepID=A0A4Y2V570_ARAVE|nr:Protein eva-1 C [Araneus ventricosus]GBO19583.1 Protein eva-1 C [Araneus ventricosus]